jgi:hypothetical protein
MTDRNAKQARLDALQQDIANLKSEYITDEQLARMTEVINAASVQNRQHAASRGLADNFFQTEELIKKLESDIASLQESDLLINNEMRLLQMQQQLQAAQNEIEQLASLIQKNPAELAHFKVINCIDHLPVTAQLYEQAQSLS